MTGPTGSSNTFVATMLSLTKDRFIFYDALVESSDTSHPPGYLECHTHNDWLSWSAGNFGLQSVDRCGQIQLLPRVPLLGPWLYSSRWRGRHVCIGTKSILHHVRCIAELYYASS